MTESGNSWDTVYLIRNESGFSKVRFVEKYGLSAVFFLFEKTKKDAKSGRANFVPI